MTGRGADGGATPQGADVLTDPRMWRSGDRCGLLPALATAGAQVRSVAEQLRGASYSRPRSLIVVEPSPTGDGDLVAALLVGPRAPVVVSATLPAWAGPLDLAVVVAPAADDGASAELVAEAARRGVDLVVRGADRGPAAAAAGGSLLAPRIAVPEIAAGAGRAAVVLAAALAADVVPAGSGDPAQVLDAIAEALDAEALACGPAVEPFVNPAVALALGLQGRAALLIADEPAGLAVARRAARDLRVIAGATAAAEHAAALVPGGQLTALLARPVDPFADPDVDGPAAAPAAILVPPPDGSRRPRLAALARVLPRAPHLSADEPGATPAARAFAAALRVAFAAAYLGIAAGQIAPPDAPNGLGPRAGVRDVRAATTVDDVPDSNVGVDPWS